MWQRGVDWFAAAIRMPAEKRYNSVLFGGRPTSSALGPLQPSPDVCLCPASNSSQPLSPPSCFWLLAASIQAQCLRVVRAPQLEAHGVGVQAHPTGPDPWGTKPLSLPGLIGSVFSFLQFLLAPLTGAISDCLGRRLVMLLSLVRGYPRRGNVQLLLACPAGL